MVLYCPYCENEINQTQLEQEDGCCPECGAPVSASTVINEEDEYEVETKRYLTVFGLTKDGSISFDIHLPALYAQLFDVFYDPADATMEDLKNITTVIHWKTNNMDSYQLLPIERYDGLSMVVTREPFDATLGPGYAFSVSMNMGDAQFRMMGCHEDLLWKEPGEDDFRFPEDVTKFYVAVTMERRIYK